MNQHLPSPPPVAGVSDPVPQPPARRSTPLWKQVIVSVVVLGLAFVGWAYLYPGAGPMLAQYGIAIPGVPPEAPPAATARPGPAGPPGAGPRGPGGPGGGRAVPVVVVQATGTATINDRLSAVGEGTAERAVTVTAAAAGTLVSLAVEPGAVVAAGALIGTLDSQSEQIAFDRATLALAEAQSALTRATELRNANAISNVQLGAAQLALSQAELEQRNAQLALERRSIRSPIAGTVGLIQVTPGNLLAAQTVVTTVEDNSDILVDFWVPERYVGDIRTGMPVAVSALAIPGQNFSGIVNAVDNRIDTTSRTLQVQARIPNADGRMRPGMSLTVALDFAGETFPMVDPLAVQWAAEGAYVWKLVDGRVNRAFVQIVQRNSGGVLVTGDIATGDMIVTQGVLQLQPGATVRLLDDLTSAAPPRAPGGRPAATH